MDKVKAQEQCDTWNNHFPVGQRVILSRDNGEQYYTKTTSEAFVAQSGHPVIHVAGVAGYYLLDRVKEGYKMATAEEVKEDIIDTFCLNCRNDDYECPNHDCPAWKAIVLLSDIECAITK